MAFAEISMNSPIEEKIIWAKRCYQTQKDQFLEDEKTDNLLKKFKGAVAASHAAMTSTGIESECRRCEEKEGGSCCGSGLENRYSGVLLLINLLLDRELPDKRRDPPGCFFLEKTGCALLARHVICVNYLCKKITDRIASEKIADLRDREGIELEILFHLNERIIKILRDEQKS
jgi:hypothetical protein